MQVIIPEFKSLRDEQNVLSFPTVICYFYPVANLDSFFNYLGLYQKSRLSTETIGFCVLIRAREKIRPFEGDTLCSFFYNSISQYSRLHSAIAQTSIRD